MKTFSNDVRHIAAICFVGLFAGGMLAQGTQAAQQVFSSWDLQTEQMAPTTPTTKIASISNPSYVSIESSYSDYEEGDAALAESPEDLLAQYMGMSNGETVVTLDALYASSYNGSKLSGLSGSVYSQLKSYVEQAAAGTITKTRFDFTFSEDQLTDYVWSAADLGVSSLYGDAAETSVNADAAKTAIDSVLNTSLAIKSVIRDCPYELFWFSNKYTISRKYTPYVKKDPLTGEPQMGLRSVSISINLGVSPDYQDANNADGYTISTVKISSIQNALAHADSILWAASGMGDQAKLDYFMQQVCNYATYDYNVNTATYPGGYGDPWQIIYVFDGDPDTGVVCEGYAKAFQYLCDQSGFSGWTYVYSVAGEFVIGSGEPEGHLWNLVHINGRNYLADLTNCDVNGFSTDLYMASPYAGSVDAGYSFTKGSSVYTYYYAADTRLLYSDSELYIPAASQADAGSGNIVLTRVLSYGMTGEDVQAVQQRLVDLGYLSATPDGIFGMMTWDAVNAFQLANGLGYSDGMVGNWTVGKLNGDPVAYDGSAGQGTSGQQDSADSHGADSAGQLVLTRILMYGMTGEDVQAVQQRLVDLGYLSATPDGIFGMMTWDAVNAFQLANGLGYSDGMVGNWTIGKLNSNPVAYEGSESRGDSGQNGTAGSNGTDVANASDNQQHTWQDNDGTPGSDAGVLTLSRILSYGMTGEDVYAVQLLLYEKGYLSVAPDGGFGAYTQDAVIRFQEDNGIYADGLVGNTTLSILQK